MRYFTWQEPYTLTPGSKLFAVGTITASEECIIEAQKYKYSKFQPGVQLPDVRLLDDFIVVHWAWETDEHGQKL